MTSERRLTWKISVFSLLVIFVVVAGLIRGRYSSTTQTASHVSIESVSVRPRSILVAQQDALTVLDLPSLETFAELRLQPGYMHEVYTIPDSDDFAVLTRTRKGTILDLHHGTTFARLRRLRLGHISACCWFNGTAVGVWDKSGRFTIRYVKSAGEAINLPVAIRHVTDVAAIPQGLTLICAKEDDAPGGLNAESREQLKLFLVKEQDDGFEIMSERSLGLTDPIWFGTSENAGYALLCAKTRVSVIAIPTLNVLVTHNISMDEEPSFASISWDGRWIAFGNSRLCLLDVDTGRQSVLDELSDALLPQAEQKIRNADDYVQQLDLLARFQLCRVHFTKNHLVATTRDGHCYSWNWRTWERTGNRRIK